MTPNTPPGPGIDASGQSVIDPSQNTKELQAASITRIDDMAALRADHSEKTAALSAEHAKELRLLGDEHARELRLAETARINAILTSNDDKVQRAAEVQATQALTLATQVTTSAEALRASQASAAIASDTKLVTALEPIQKRIDDLSRAQSEAVGQKTQVVETRDSVADMAPVLEAIAKLSVAQADTGGRRAQSTDMRAWIVAAIAAVTLGLGYLSTREPAAAPTSPAPVIIMPGVTPTPTP